MMPEELKCNVERFLAFLVAREALIFSTKVVNNFLWSLARIYCAKAVWICTLPLKRLAVAPRHSYQVRVLLNELYPEQESVVGSSTFYRNDFINIDDYVLSLQKVGLDGACDGQMDEINFLFQTNHLPISVFRENSPTTNNEVPADECQPSCSSVCSQAAPLVKPSSPMKPQLIVSVKPEADDLLLSPCPANITGDSMFSQDNCENTLESTPSPFKSAYKEPGSNDNFDNRVTCEIPNFTDGLIPYFPSRLPVRRNGQSFDLFRRTKRHSTCSSSSSCFEDPVVPFASTHPLRLSAPPKVVFRPSPLFSGPLPTKKVLSKPLPPVSSKSTTVASSVLKSLSNLHRATSTSHIPIETVDAPVSVTPFVWPRYDKPRFAFMDENSQVESDLPPSLSVTSAAAESSPISSSSFSSAASSVYDGHSSDSEVYRRHQDFAFSSLRPQPLTKWEEETGEVEEEEEDEKDLEEYEYHLMKPLDGFTSAAENILDDSSSNSGLFHHVGAIGGVDRHIRDVRILEKLAVPFSYEEVAYSSNEHFREIKATPGLTIDQITAMLDARRRATNRQAAERCRRVKSAARDGLAVELERLRLEHVDLSRRILRTRKRRQRKRDELTMAQQQLLCSLVDGEGKPLDPTKWRVQTTAGGELIVVQQNPHKSLLPRSTNDINISETV